MPKQMTAVIDGQLSIFDWMEDFDPAKEATPAAVLPEQVKEPEVGEPEVGEFNALDSISRQDAIEVVQNRPMMLSKEKVLLINDLEKLPQTKLKREKTRFVYENGKWICEKCGNEIRQIDQSGFFIFCPSCGAEKEMKRL